MEAAWVFALAAIQVVLCRLPFFLPMDPKAPNPAGAHPQALNKPQPISQNPKARRADVLDELSILNLLQSASREAGDPGNLRRAIG